MTKKNLNISINKNLKIFLNYALFALVLIYIFQYANFDIYKFASISLWDFTLISILSIALFFLNGMALKLSMKAFKGEISFGESFYISQYFGLFNYLPLKAGIIATAVHLKTKHDFPVNKYIACTALSYLTNFLVYFLVGIPLVLFFDFSHVFQIIKPIYFILFVLIILVVVLLYLFLPESVKHKHKYFGYLECLFQSRNDLKNSHRYVIYSIFISAIILAVTALRLMIIFNVLSYQIPWHIVLMLAILTGFSFIVALTPGNLVVREVFLGGLTYIMFGDADIGVVISVVMRLFDLFWLLIFGAYSFFKLNQIYLQKS